MTVSKRASLAIVGGVLACTVVMARPHAQHHGRAAPEATKPGHTRTYYIAADELDWDYAPSGTDQIHGEKYHFQDDPGSKGTLNPNATTYRKALFREYTDATFGTLKPRPDAWAHLGALGPLIRAEVGDSITVVFKNNASRAYSIHPHGVFYKKDAEGAGYQDGSIDSDKKDDAVAPGGTYTYMWTVPERAGPTSVEGSTALWLYHSHVDEGRDINSGLIGPLIVTRRGMARPDASPTDVAREFVTQFGIYDEHLSWYWDFNLKRLYRDPKDYDVTVQRMREFHHFYTINGWIDGNGPMLTMRQGEHVRWYLFANPNEEEVWDVHTAHWHGETAIAGHMRTDMIMLTPMMTMVADMVPDSVGTWLFHCHMPGHFAAGMRTRFQVLPR
jgi:FtsP/CotA-like multicopper oxidase with cupredoxin domain